MYTFKTNISNETHDNFVMNHPLCSLLQSSSWAKIKDNWDHQIVGIYKNEELVASSLVLIKRLPFHLSMMYIPRGPIMDYSNKELSEFYFKNIRKWAKKFNCLFIKFDPAIVAKEYLVKDKDCAKLNREVLTIINDLEKLKIHHLGFTKDMMDTIQPRYQMGLYKCDDLSKVVKKDTLKSRNAAARKHVFAKRYGKEKLDKFADLMVKTEMRKGVALRNYDYFEKLMNIYQDHSYLFIVSVDPSLRIKEVEHEISEIENKLKDGNLTMKGQTKLNKDLLNLKKEYDSIYEVSKNYQGVQDIAGALMIGFGNTIEMLYAGMDSEFKAFRPQDYLYYERFEFVFNEGYEYASMGGVEGSLTDGLTEYKSKFNALVREYIGEFEIPVNVVLYKLSKIAYTLRKKRIL